LLHSLDLSHRRVRPALPSSTCPSCSSLSRSFPRVECRSSFEHENGKARCGSAAASETNKGINNHHHHHRHRRSGIGSTGTTITTTPPWPSLRRAISRFFFRETSILEMCRDVARLVDLFVRDTRGAGACGGKKNFRLLRLEIGRVCTMILKTDFESPMQFSVTLYI